jgi:hypothetical protein
MTQSKNEALKGIEYAMVVSEPCPRLKLFSFGIVGAHQFRRLSLKK